MDISNLRALLAEQEELAPRIGVEMVRLVEVEGVSKASIARAVDREPSEIWRRVERWGAQIDGLPPSGKGRDLDSLVVMMKRYDDLPPAIDAEVVRLTNEGGIPQAELARALGVSRQEIQRRVRRHYRRVGGKESW